MGAPKVSKLARLFYLSSPNRARQINQAPAKRVRKKSGNSNYTQLLLAAAYTFLARCDEPKERLQQQQIPGGKHGRLLQKLWDSIW